MLLSQRAYAKHRGVSDAAVRKAIATGRITPNSNGLIDPDIADKEWAENTRAGQSEHINSDYDTAASRKNSRAMREAYEAALKKLEYERETGKLIPVAQVSVNAYNVGRMTRDKLKWVGIRATSKIIGKTDAREIQQIIDDEVSACITGLVESLRGDKS